MTCSAFRIWKKNNIAWSKIRALENPLRVPRCNRIDRIIQPLPLPFLQSHTTPHCISFHPACCFADRHYHINKQRKIPKSVSGNSVSLRLVQHCLVVLYSTVWFFLSWGFVRSCPDILSPIGEKLSRNMFF